MDKKVNESIFDYWRRLEDEEQERFLANYRVKSRKVIPSILKVLKRK